MQISQPLVSVVIPCYNHEDFVQDSIQSVIDQTYDNIELIIIDDGSKDNSVIKIQEMIELCEKRFNRFEFRSRANIGLSATFNEGLEWCNGEYFTANASDDILLPKKIELQVEFLEKSKGVVAVFGGFILIDSTGKELSKNRGTNSFYSFKDIILLDSKLSTPTQMVRTASIKEVGGYNPDTEIEDWYMWLKLSLIGNLYAMEEIVSLYRVHDNNTSAQSTNMHNARIRILDDYKDSKYYKKAIKRTMWLNASEGFYGNHENKLLHYIRMMFYDPSRTIKRTLRRISQR